MNEFKSFDIESCACFLADLANNNKKLLIITHRNPDGDAVGSSFALKKIYELLGGSAICACQSHIPEYLKKIVGNNEEFLTDVNCEYDTIITVDTASPSQMGDLQNLSTKVALSIDHHENHTPYAPDLRDGNASAAGELIFKIYNDLLNKGLINKNAKVCRLIYTAISTDTGSFQYSNTTPETMSILAKVMETVNNDSNSMNTAEISRLLYHSKTLKEILNKKVFIDNLQITDNRRIGYIVITREIMLKNDLREDELGGAIDIPRAIDTVECAFVLKEENTSSDSEKSFRMSLRSNSELNVADICKKFGGGGHAKAAGGSITAESKEKAIEIVLNEINSALNEVI